MAADLLLLGVEFVAAVTVALIAVFLLRTPVRTLFGSRAAYCLWLLVPAMALAVALPRPVAGEKTLSPPTPAVAGPARTAVVATATAQTASDPGIEHAQFLPDPAAIAAPLMLAWALGVLVFAGLLTHGQQRFLRALGPLRAEQRPDGRVFHAERCDVGPALVGALTSRIVLPADFSERFSPEEQRIVVAHERVHQSGGDAQINLVVAATRVLLWFHPLVHFAAGLIRTDQELACDETVIARFPTARRLYAGAMLKTQLIGSPVPLGCHWLTGGKTELRHRITHLTRTCGRPRRMIGAALAILLALTGGAVAWAAQPAVPTRSTPVSASTRNLLAAIQDGRNTEAVALIEAGANVDGWWLGDGSALILAARSGQIELARLLLERGANPNLSVPGDGNPLIAAAGAGHVGIVDLLLASGARIDAVVPSDETALITAARQGQLAVVRRLVERGADVNLAVMAPRIAPLEPELRSPLAMALRAGRPDIADYLIAHGAHA